MKTFNEHRMQLVYLFDRVYQDKIFSETDQEKLADLISNIADELLASTGAPELKSIFNKYNEADFDTQSDMSMQMV